MQDKELSKLGKTDLLTIIYEQEKKIKKLNEKTDELEKELEDREIKIEESGSIAEASLKLNKVFETAQQAADEYLKNIKEVNNQQFKEKQKNDDQYNKSVENEIAEDKSWNENKENEVSEDKFMNEFWLEDIKKEISENEFWLEDIKNESTENRFLNEDKNRSINKNKSKEKNTKKINKAKKVSKGNKKVKKKRNTQNKAWNRVRF